MAASLDEVPRASLIMNIQLLVRVDNKPEKTLTVNKDVIIGRSKTCQFRVLSNDVSREHCKLIVSDEVIAIRDLGSSNGTIVNGKSIPTGIDVLLHPGTNVEVGPLKFVVQFKSKARVESPVEPAPVKTPPTPATEKAAATEKPAKAKTAAPTKEKSVEKPAAPKSSAAPAKKAAKKPVPAAPVAEAAFPFDSGTADTEENPAWPDFLLGDSSDEGPTIAHAPAPAAEGTVTQPAEEFSFGGDDEDEPVFDFSEPEAATVAPQPVAETIPPSPTPPVTAPAAEVAVPDAAESVAEDEPVFGEFAGGDDDSEFAFDPEAAAASAPATPTPTPTVAAKPEEKQPGKLKSLFGLFGKGKADKATPTAAPTKPAAAPSTPTPAPVAPPAATTPSVAGEEDGLNDFLTGGSGAANESDDDTPDWMKQLS